MVEVWVNKPDDTYKLKTLKESDIKRAEKFFGIGLPKDYRALDSAFFSDTFVRIMLI